VPNPLQELLAKQAITERLHDYARGVDRVDTGLIRSVFHDDATADYGPMYTGSGHGFADFIAEVHPPLEAHSHHLSNISIRVDGDRAGSETYVMVRLRSRAADGRRHDIVSLGRYVDRWECREGAWRVTERRYLHTMDETRPVVASGFETTGTRAGDDPSYGVLSGLTS
jgi:hypothetical protein